MTENYQPRPQKTNKSMYPTSDSSRRTTEHKNKNGNLWEEVESQKLTNLEFSSIKLYATVFEEGKRKEIKKPQISFRKKEEIKFTSNHSLPNVRKFGHLKPTWSLEDKAKTCTEMRKDKWWCDFNEDPTYLVKILD